MLAHIHSTLPRQIRAASGAIVCLLLTALALAYITPDSPAYAPGVARRLFMFAFFVRTFEMHLGLALVFPLLVLVAMRRWVASAIAFIGILWTLAPVAWSCVRPSPVALTLPIRVMSANLLVGHADVAPLIDQIRSFEPDIIFFQEYTPEKARALVPLLETTYPHRVEALRDGVFGQAVYSKVAFDSEPELYPHDRIRSQGSMQDRAGGEVGIWDPQIRVPVSWGGTQIVLQNIHFAPPIHSSYLREQRLMVRWICEWLAEDARPVVIAGDFNSTQTSVNLCDLARAGLTDSRDAAGRGWAGTWPADGPLSVAPVAIDHVLTRALRVESSTPGISIASDHLPLLVVVGPR